jgi:trigger factor
MTDEHEPTGTQPESGTTVAEHQPEAAPEEEGGEPKPEKLHQTVELRDVGPCKKHIKVTIPRDDIDKRLNEKFSELVVDANVAGFRPGKAPRKIIERRFHKDVTDQVKAQVLLESLEQLAEENDVAPLSAPDIRPDAIDIPKDGPMVYEFEVEVRPQFDLPNYRGLRLRRPVRDFTDEDVAVEQKRILAPYGQLVPKPEGGAELGDYLTADMTTRAGDRVIGTVKEATFRVDPRLAFKDGVAERFGEQVKGARASDSRVVDITMADSVADPGLRGRKVQGTLEVKDVKTVRLPELTHEFLHNFGVHSEEQLRERIRILLQARLQYQQRQSAREQVLSQIAAATHWELPQDLLMRQARKAMARRVMEMQDAGMPEEEIRGRQRLLQQDILQSTAQALKEHFVLQKIAEVEKIDVGDEEINDEIDRIAEQNNESPRKIRARLEKDDLLDTLAAQIIERKTLDLILDSAEYEDVPLGQEEGAVATVEEQAVEGEMKDPTAAPPAAEAAAAETPGQPPAEGTTPPAQG